MFDEQMKLEEQFEKEGEEKVSVDLLLGRYGAVDSTFRKALIAKAWLEKKKAYKEEMKRQEELQLIKEANRISKESIYTTCKKDNYGNVNCESQERMF